MWPRWTTSPPRSTCSWTPDDFRESGHSRRTANRPHEETTMTSPGTWQPTACILCECNCGIEVLLGEDGRTFSQDPRGQAASRFAGVHVQQGPAPGSLPERPSRATDHAAAAHTCGRLRGDRLGHGHRGDSRPADGRSRRPRRADDLLLRRRWAGQPPRRGPLNGDHGRLRCPVPLQRAGPGEDRRVLGERAHARELDPRRLRALRGGVVPGQEPLPVPWLPAGTQRPEGDRQGSRALDDRRRPGAHRVRGAGRCPPAGPTGHRPVPDHGSGGGPRAVRPGRP